MSQLSPTYCTKVERWILGGVPLEKMNMRPDQMFRAHLVTEAYEHWIGSPHIEPRKMLKNFAARKYQFLLRCAREGSEEAREMVEALHITEQSVRSENEISNDVSLLNFLTGRLSTSKKNIHRAMFESNIEWMQNFGRKTGTWQAVKQANQDLAKINNDFKDDDDPQEQMPSTNINITGDVSIIKSDRKTMSDEEREQLRKKYGMTIAEEREMREAVEAEYVELHDDEDDAPDIFVENEQERQ